MIRNALFALFLSATPAFAVGLQEGTCHAEVPCPLGDRSYHVLEPDSWDGTSPLPVLLHFHGWARQGTLIVKHGRIAGATRKRGVLLVAPNGLGKSWNFWRPETEDVPFAQAVLKDVAKRYPIDQSKIYVSGYSFGSAMAWRYACENGNQVSALLAVAGTLDQYVQCPQAPAEVRHVHGTSDTVMDFPFGPNGDTTYPVALWRSKFHCGPGTDRGDWSITKHDTFTRTTWDSCAKGKVTLDVHSRGHFIPRGWIARQLDELLELKPSYP
ncbi:alpha/beta hydrolase family esterase [Roseovarius albus]|nr:polyhydroxybutyrate depolymerase [Roseovarius albus]